MTYKHELTAKIVNLTPDEPGYFAIMSDISDGDTYTDRWYGCWSVYDYRRKMMRERYPGCGTPVGTRKYNYVPKNTTRHLRSLPCHFARRHKARPSRAS